jgi:hypothetical protein
MIAQPMNSWKKSISTYLRLPLPLTLLSGCQVTPSVPLLGAYFPDWMFCGLFALLVTLLFDRLLAVGGWRRSFDHWALLLSHTALFVSTALLFWLFIFRN